MYFCSWDMRILAPIALPEHYFKSNNHFEKAESPLASPPLPRHISQSILYLFPPFLARFPTSGDRLYSLKDVRCTSLRTWQNHHTDRPPSSFPLLFSLVLEACLSTLRSFPTGEISPLFSVVSKWNCPWMERMCLPWEGSNPPELREHCAEQDWELWRVGNYQQCREDSPRAEQGEARKPGLLSTGTSSSQSGYSTWEHLPGASSLCYLSDSELFKN